MTSGVPEVQSDTFLNFTLHYTTKLEDIKEVLEIYKSDKNKPCQAIHWPKAKGQQHKQ
jgi:hypothetical protein